MSGVINKPDDHVPEQHKAHRRGNNKKSNLLQPRPQPFAQSSSHLRVAAQRCRHRRQLRRRNRHAEQAHRQRVQRLRIRQSRDRTRPQKTAQPRIDIGADLHHSATQEHRKEIPAHRARMQARKIQVQPQRPQKPQHRSAAARGTAARCPTIEPIASSTARRGCA